MPSPRVWFPIVIALVAVLVALDRRPLRLPTESARIEAASRWRDDGHGTLLLLDDGPARDGDPSREWENLLRQTFGGFDVLPVDRLGDGDRARLAERSLLVLPRRTLQVLPLDARDRIDRRVEDGGLAVLTEAPDSAWAAHLGLRIAAMEWRDPLPWPLAPQPPSVQRPQLPPPPTSLHFRWTVWRYAPDPRAQPRTRSTARIAGRPAAWYRPVGDGAWSILSLDFGRLAHRLRQGGDDPAPGAPKPPARGDGGRRTSDLVLSADLLDRDEPWLDAWSAALLRSEIAAAPWPRLATAPFARDGWFLLGLSQMPRPEALPATVHLSPPTSMPPVMHAKGDVGLLTAWPSETTWRQRPDLRQTFGVGPLRPVGRLPDLRRQKQRLASVLPPGASLELNHNRHSLWSDPADLAFETLQAAGMRGDSSFGPAGSGAGWSFGSAQPFRPLDARGRSFDLWEVPYLATGPADALDARRLDLWLRRNRFGARGPVLLQITPSPNRGSDLLQGFAEQARRENHRLVALTQLLDWWERREQTRLHWKWSDPTLTVRVTEAPTADADRLALLLPRAWHDRVLATWSTDPPGSASRRVWAFDEALLAVEIPASETTVTVVYARTP